MFEEQLDGELISEEDVSSSEGDGVRALPREYEDRRPLPAIREDVANAAIAVAGGALAGVVTVAAVRAVAGSSSSRRRRRKLSKRGRPANVVASRSFLVDVHMLGR